MKKIEAKTLEEAYAKAAETFDCSVTDLEYEIVQHPSSGFLGIGAKNAIIVAACRTPRSPGSAPSIPKQKPSQSRQPEITAPQDTDTVTQPSHPQSVPSSEPENSPENGSEAEILNGFFDERTEMLSDTPKSSHTPPNPPQTEKALGEQIEAQLGQLMRSACFEIDTVEVDVIDGTAYIFIDGEDAALLIGKEGYRYNAISYLLYNWLHNEYGLFIKLEIAQFLASQQEMIRNYIQPVVEHVHREGWGKTRPLDGILVQIALEQLREEFPDKYVAIKRTRNNERYILINEFNKRT